MQILDKYGSSFFHDIPVTVYVETIFSYIAIHSMWCVVLRWQLYLLQDLIRSNNEKVHIALDIYSLPLPFWLYSLTLNFRPVILIL